MRGVLGARIGAEPARRFEFTQSNVLHYEILSRLHAFSPSRLLAFSPSRLLAFAALSITITGFASAQITYLVDDDADQGTGDGLTWPKAFTTLDAALAVASSTSGDTILVAHGRYTPSTAAAALRDPSDKRTATFTLKPNVKVIGGFRGLDAGQNGGSTAPALPDGSPRLTILSGNILDDGLATDNCYNVVAAPATAGEELQVLQRVTVSDGYADGPDQGAAEFDYQLNGAGVYCSQLPGPGGGKLELTECLFVDNYAENNGGAVFFYGESSTDNYFAAAKCLVADNEAGQRGGGFHLRAMGAMPADKFVGISNQNGSYVMNCSFFGNRAGFDAVVLGRAGGGAVWVDGLTSAFTFQMSNNLAAENVVKGHGAAYAFAGTQGRVSVANDTIFGNTVDETNGSLPSAAYFENGSPGTQTFANNIVWGNVGRTSTSQSLGVVNLFENGGPAMGVTTSNCDIERVLGAPAYPGTANIFAKPQFSNVSARDFTLLDTSPCIDAGSSAARNRDLADLDLNNTRNEPLPRDFRASVLVPRVIGTSVDIGAFEQ